MKRWLVAPATASTGGTRDWIERSCRLDHRREEAATVDASSKRKSPVNAGLFRVAASASPYVFI
jgi:hypothetical protein